MNPSKNVVDISGKPAFENIIEFKNIQKVFPGVIALNDVSLSIKKAEIHTIAGENGAGKSTLMKILAGLYHPEGGEVIFKGEAVTIPNPLAAINMGIATVYQELKLCENLSVVENIYLGREIKKRNGSVDWKTMHRKAKSLLDIFETGINTKSIVKKLAVAQMQIVEIAKAINLDADVLILDEPTSSLTINETEVLFGNLKKFKDNGVTIIFISHRLEEVFEITDRISVLRDGQYLGTFEAENISPKEVVTLIAGKELTKEYEQHQSDEECGCPEVALGVKNLSRGKFFRDISFQLHEGEILGFYGLQGAGRTELMETIFGMYRPDGGEIILRGEEIEIESPTDAIKKGFVLIPEDRRRSGIFSNMDVKDNVAIIHNKEITGLTFLQNPKINKLANEYVRKLSIKVSGIMQMIRNLSGGNQQKVVISRCLSTDPSILLMDEPTRGIDVGAKAEIFRILRKLKNEERRAIIVVSSELQEVVAECDRVIVMCAGRISGVLSGKEITKENVLQHAFSGSGGDVA